jgi:hypothetical protein
MIYQLFKKSGVLLPFIIISIVSYLEASKLKSQIVLNSDSLYMHDLTKDLLSGGSIFNWSLTQAPDYFPHMFVYLLVSIFIKNATYQLFLITLFQVISLGFLIYLVLRSLKQSKYSSVLQAVALLTIINLFQLRSADWIYFYKTNNHFSSVSLGLLTLILLIYSFNDKKVMSKRGALLVFVIVFLGTMSTITFIYAVTIPIFMLLVIELWRAQTTRQIRILKWTIHCWLIVIPVATFLAIILTFQANSSRALESRFDLSKFDQSKIQELFLSAFSRNVISSGQTVRYISLLIIFIIVLNFFIFFLCPRIWLIGLNADYSLVLLLDLCIYSLIFSFTVATFSGGIVDEYFLRYFLPSIIMSMIFASVFGVQIYSLRRKSSSKKAKTGIILFSALLIFFSFSGKSFQSSTSPYGATAQCINDLRSRGIALDAGVADYWFGRSVDYMSSGSNRTYVALNNLEPFYWMTSDSFYKLEAYYNFIILHTTPDQFNFNSEAMQALLPSPSNVYKCQNTQMVVHYYDNESLDLLVQNQVEKYLSRPL